MGCGESCCKKMREQALKGQESIDVGAPRIRPEISDKRLWHEREQESELSNCVANLPPTLLQKLSKQSSKISSECTKETIHMERTVRGETFLSVDSQLEFANASQTIIIFDWDDTLCPSSSMRELADFDRFGRLKSKLNRETSRELKMLSDVVVPLLKLAKTLGHVIIVTNARSPWVDMSCQSFLPAVKDSLHGIPITYALELVKPSECYDEGNGCLLTETKARAMKAAVSEFYSRYPGQSWKNIISIGDAYFEHDAIRQVVGNNPQEKTCRTKTIKLLEGPTTAGMVVQLSIIKSWLQQIVQTNKDINIDLMDEESMNKGSAAFGAPQEA